MPPKSKKRKTAPDGIKEPESKKAKTEKQKDQESKSDQETKEIKETTEVKETKETQEATATKITDATLQKLRSAIWNETTIKNDPNALREYLEAVVVHHIPLGNQPPTKIGKSHVHALYQALISVPSLPSGTSVDFIDYRPECILLNFPDKEQWDLMDIVLEVFCRTIMQSGDFKNFTSENVLPKISAIFMVGVMTVVALQNSDENEIIVWIEKAVARYKIILNERLINLTTGETGKHILTEMLLLKVIMHRTNTQIRILAKLFAMGAEVLFEAIQNIIDTNHMHASLERSKILIELMKVLLEQKSNHFTEIMVLEHAVMTPGQSPTREQTKCNLIEFLCERNSLINIKQAKNPYAMLETLALHGLSRFYEQACNILEKEQKAYLDEWPIEYNPLVKFLINTGLNLNHLKVLTYITERQKPLIKKISSTMLVSFLQNLLSTKGSEFDISQMTLSEVTALLSSFRELYNNMGRMDNFKLNDFIFVFLCGERNHLLIPDLLGIILEKNECSKLISEVNSSKAFLISDLIIPKSIGCGFSFKKVLEVYEIIVKAGLDPNLLLSAFCHSMIFVDLGFEKRNNIAKIALSMAVQFFKQSFIKQRLDPKTIIRCIDEWCQRFTTREYSYALSMLTFLCELADFKIPGYTLRSFSEGFSQRITNHINQRTYTYTTASNEQITEKYPDFNESTEFTLTSFLTDRIHCNPSQKFVFSTQPEKAFYNLEDQYGSSTFIEQIVVAHNVIIQMQKYVALHKSYFTQHETYQKTWYEAQENFTKGMLYTQFLGTNIILNEPHGAQQLKTAKTLEALYLRYYVNEFFTKQAEFERKFASLIGAWKESMAQQYAKAYPYKKPEEILKVENKDQKEQDEIEASLAQRMIKTFTAALPSLISSSWSCPSFDEIKKSYDYQYYTFVTKVHKFLASQKHLNAIMPFNRAFYAIWMIIQQTPATDIAYPVLVHRLLSTLSKINKDIDKYNTEVDHALSEQNHNAPVIFIQSVFYKLLQVLSGIVPEVKPEDFPIEGVDADGDAILTQFKASAAEVKATAEALRQVSNSKEIAKI